MNKTSRILLLSCIGVLGILNAILLAATVYSLAFMDLDLKEYFDVETIIVTMISTILGLSFIPAIIFHIHIIKPAKIFKNDKEIAIGTTNQPKFNLSKVIWMSNIVFGIVSIILGIQILKVTISEHLLSLNEKYHDYVNVNYYNYFVAIIIVIVGLKIIMDGIHLHKTGDNKVHK